MSRLVETMKDFIALQSARPAGIAERECGQTSVVDKEVDVKQRLWMVKEGTRRRNGWRIWECRCNCSRASSWILNYVGVNWKRNARRGPEIGEMKEKVPDP